MEDSKVIEQNAIDRICAIAWNNLSPRLAGDPLLLFYEYCRRAAIWMNILHKQSNEMPYTIFFDVGHRFAGNDIFQMVNYDELHSQIHKGLAHGKEPFSITTIAESCYFHIKWCLLNNLGKISLTGPESPYEPLIKLYEQGFGFYSLNGEVDIYPDNADKPEKFTIYSENFLNYDRTEPFISL